MNGDVHRGSATEHGYNSELEEESGFAHTQKMP